MSQSWRRVVGLTVCVGAMGFPVATAPADDLLDLVPKKASWRYLDDGTDQLKAWREPAFDDSAWAEGKAELGFGDGGEATKLKPGPSNNRTITFYFRHQFQVSADVLRNYHLLMLELLVDDGAVVHVNGTPVVTVNLAEEPFYDELAEKIIWDTIEGRPTLHRLSLDVLVPGENVIAVEVHQAEIEGVDASFDLRLSAGRVAYGQPVPVTRFEEGTFVAGTFGVDGRRSLILSRNPELFAEPVFSTYLEAVDLRLCQWIWLNPAFAHPSPPGNVIVWRTNVFDEVPGVPRGLKDIVSVSCDGDGTGGSAFGLALLGTDGRVVAWGHNAYRECDVPTMLEGILTIARSSSHWTGNISFPPVREIVLRSWNLEHLK